MLKNIPKELSPELLKILCEMGHGDEIVIDIPGGEVSLLVSEEELQERRKRWVCPPLKEEKGCLNLFARLCRPAEEGGAMQPWDLDAKFHG